MNIDGYRNLAMLLFATNFVSIIVIGGIVDSRRFWLKSYKNMLHCFTERELENIKLEERKGGTP